MKRILQVLLAGLICCFDSAAQATVITFNFEVKVRDLSETTDTYGPWTNVTQSNFAGTPIALGDILVGSFRYDTTSGLSSWQSPQYPGPNHLVYEAGPNDVISFVDRNTGLALTTQPQTNWPWVTEVHNGGGRTDNYTPDTFKMSRYALNGDLTTVLSIGLYDYSGNSWNNVALPTELDLGSFTFGTFGGSYFRMNENAGMSFSGLMTKLERADVPEPSSTLLFAIAAGGLVGLRRMRRSRS